MLQFRRSLIIGILLSLVLPISVIAQTAESGGIGGRPGFPREENPRSESIFVHTVEPGSSVDDGINVINNAGEQKTIAVYGTDSVNSSGGTFACAQKVDDRIDVGSWITLASDLITVDSAGSQVVPFTIDVPFDTPPGEHNGCIVVQEDKADPTAESGIGLSFRTAIRVAILVPGEIVKSLEITDFKILQDNEGIVLTPNITNTGNVSVDANILTTLHYPFGFLSSEVGGEFPVLRGVTGEWNFDHDKPFWGGPIKAAVSASYDDGDESFIGDDSGSSNRLEYPEQWIFVWPQPLAAAIEAFILLVVLGGIYLLFRRIKRRRNVKKTWKSYKVKTADDIKSLAKNRNTSWRQIAKVNKLKAPYSLEKGQTISLPPAKKPRRKKIKVELK